MNSFLLQWKLATVMLNLKVYKTGQEQKQEEKNCMMNDQGPFYFNRGR